MPYVRINMVEFKSKEDMQRDMDELQNNMKSFFSRNAPIYFDGSI